MTYVDTLSTRFVLDSGQYTANAARVVASTQKVGAAIQKAKGAGGFGTLFDDVAAGAKDALSALGPLKDAVLGIFAVGAGGAAAGYGLMRQAAEFDSLRQSLIAVEGDAKKANKALADLKELARAPGLGFEEAVRGYSGLRNAGLTQGFAEKLIKELANANARGGGNAETFGRILTQIRQAAGRKFLAQEDLSPIGEAGIPINKILKDAFGTGDTEELKKRGIGAQEALEGIVKELSKLQRVAGGAQNDFDNLGDAFKFAAVSAGDALNQSLLPYVSKFATAVGDLTDSGVIQSAFQGIAENVVDILGVASDDVGESLLPLVAGLQTLSGGFRNLKNNAIGLYDLLDKISRLTPGGYIAGRMRDQRKGNTEGIDLGSEYERNLDALQSQYAGFKRKKKAPITTAADKPEEKKVAEKQVELLERIAINTGRMVEALDDATSGGGALSEARSSVKELSGVQGGYNRRFRRMGA